MISAVLLPLLPPTDRLWHRAFPFLLEAIKTYRLRHIKTVTVERSELQHQDVDAM